MPRIVDKRGLVCEIHNSFERGADKGWLQGDFEGEKVVVLNTFEARDAFASRSMIKWFDKPADKLPQIPVQYLRPVNPTKIGQEVCLLSGDHLAEDGIVRDVITPNAVVQLKATILMMEVRLDKLCLTVPVSAADLG